MTIFLTAAALIAGYLIGSIMNAVLIAKAKHTDIRKCGSGNAGSTNILRTFGWKWGLLCLVLDSLKGVISVFIGKGLGLLAMRFFEEQVFIADFEVFLGCVAFFGALLGHLLPVFFQFRGGKSVAVALGGFLVLSPIQLLIALGIAIVLIAITRMVSVGSIIGTLITSVLVIIKHFGNIPIMVMAVVVFVIVLIAHLPNIQRIMEGRERKIENIEWESDSDQKK